MGSLPPPWRESLMSQILAAIAIHQAQKRVVLDDDPVGNQTVVGDDAVPLLTEWSVESLREELADSCPRFVLLMGSRTVARDEAQGVVHEVCHNLRAAAGSRSLSLVSRWHTSLQGHFPLETDTIGEILGPFDATLLIPHFDEDDRWTVDDIHYFVRGDELVPIAETVHAIGYVSSNLRDWVAEKTGRRIAAENVASITLNHLRGGGPVVVTQQLLNLPMGAVCVVNAAVARDLEVFVAALYAAEALGRRFLVQAAAQFELFRWGLRPRGLVTAAELELATRTRTRSPPKEPPARDYSPPEGLQPPVTPHRQISVSPAQPRGEANRFACRPAQVPGGLVIVGSRRPKTAAQLHHLLSGPGILPLEIPAAKLLTSRRQEIIHHTLSVLTAALTAGQDVVLFPGLQPVPGQCLETNLQIERRLSSALIELVRRMQVRPRYLLAKGLSTANNLARDALRVKRVLLLGQVTAGVPVWRLGVGAKFPDLPYVVFPGDAGGVGTLAEVMQKLAG
jgi:uncharacterized protein YgbK (DUF1537 family)